MTEKEWLTCADPAPMLDFLRGKVSERKVRLFAVACCFRVRPFLGKSSRQLVEITEQFADGLTSETELRTANLAYDADGDPALHAAADPGAILPHAIQASKLASNIAGHEFKSINLENRTAFDECITNEQAAQCEILRDIIGLFPFRMAKVKRSSLAPSATSLAQTIYDERVFDRMPILADALEEAGCTNAEILGHCRSAGPHVRGCWVIDLLTGRE